MTKIFLDHSSLIFKRLKFIFFLTKFFVGKIVARVSNLEHKISLIINTQNISRHLLSIDYLRLKTLKLKTSILLEYKCVIENERTWKKLIVTNDDVYLILPLILSFYFIKITWYEIRSHIWDYKFAREDYILLNICQKQTLDKR